MRSLLACSALFLCAWAHPSTFIDTLDSYWQQLASDRGSGSNSAPVQEQSLLAQLILAQRQQLLANRQLKQHQQLRPHQREQKLLNGYDPRLLEHNAVGKLWDDGNAAAAELLSKLRPENSKLDLSTSGDSRGLGIYVQVLPDEEYGDEPIYSVGGSVRGGEEPSRLNYGYLSRPLG